MNKNVTELINFKRKLSLRERIVNPQVYTKSIHKNKVVNKIQKISFLTATHHLQGRTKGAPVHTCIVN